MKEKASIGIVIFLVFIFCAINMALGDPVEMGIDGGIVDGGVIEEMPEQSAVQASPKYLRSVYSQKRVRVYQIQNVPEDIPIIKTGSSLGDIVEVTDLINARSICNVLIVGPQKEINEGESSSKKRKVPIVSNEKLNELWGKKGNSWPVKLNGAKHPLPEYYWNILLKGDACKLVADEEDFYLCSDWKQLLALPDNIKKAVIRVKVITTENVDGGMKDVEKTFFWGDPEILNAKEVLYLIFPHSWSGRNDLNILDPALLEYRKNNK